MTTKIFKITFIIFILALPFDNSDLFWVFTPKLFYSRLAFIFVGLAFAALLAVGGLVRLCDFLKKVFSDWPFRLLLATFIARAISITGSKNLGNSLFLIAFFAAVVLLYLVIFYLGETQKAWLKGLFLKLYLGVAYLTSFYGLTQIILLVIGKKLPGVLVGGSFLRVPATFYDANHLPPLLISAIPLTLSLSWTQKSRLKSLLFLILSGLMSFLVFSTFSRSGILGLGVAFFFFVTYLFRFRYWRKISLIGSVFLALLVIVILSSRTNLSLVKRAASVINPLERSTSAHGLLLSGEWYLFTKHPIFGVGYGSFDEYFRASPIGEAHAKIDPAVGIRLPTHSIWLEALCETGLLGFIPYALLIAFLVHFLAQATEKATSKKEKLATSSLAASAVGILIGGIFYSYNLLYFWFFLFGASILARRRAFAGESHEEESERINWGEVLSITSLIVISIFIIFGFVWSRNVSGKEALLAVLSKSVLRDWERSWPHWWVPIYRGADYHLPFGLTQVYVWLSAVAMFFYQINSATPRFWAGFFALISVLLVYVILRKISNLKLAFIGSLTFLACPFFLFFAYRGLPFTLRIAVVSLVIFLFAYIKKVKVRFNLQKVPLGVFILLPFISLIGFRNYIFPPNVYKNEVRLINARHTLNRNGNVPNVILGDYSATLDFYSDVPFVYTSFDNLDKEILAPRRGCYVFLPADKLFDLSKELMNKEVGLRVVAASEELLLVERM